MDPIRILVVDDHKLVREALCDALGMYSTLEVVGEACNGEQALHSVQNLMPAVVVMDVNMPRMDGIEATRRIKAAYPHIVIVGLSVNADTEHRKAMKDAGAASLLPKETISSELCAVITESTQAQAAIMQPKRTVSSSQ